MAWIKERPRKNGTVAYCVRYELGKVQTQAPFDDRDSAEEFRDAVNTIGAEKAMKAWGINPTVQVAKRSTAPTVAEWLRTYIDSRTGVTKTCIADYNAYLRNDIAPAFGQVPLDTLTPADIAKWVQGMAERERKLAGKTIANRHGFLSAALNAAVTAGHIPHNPADGTRIPRTERAEMCFLTHDEFALLHGCFTEYWRPMIAFMVASGARFGEVTALRPSDVDRTHNTVHVGRAWKRTYDPAKPYELGAPKTKRSERTISIAKAVLDDLDYTGEYLFLNSAGNPVRAATWRNNIWYPAVKKAKAAGLVKAPRIHDMRHTCASWMIAGGASMYAVQRHLGHESIQTTISLYTHLDRKDAQAAADIIGNVLKPKG